MPPVSGLELGDGRVARGLPRVAFPGNPLGPFPGVYRVESIGSVRDSCVRCLIMKMLLASNELLALQPVAKRLVASGIPIALLRPSEISACLEIWIQRDSDFCLARRLLPAAVCPPAATRSPANPLGAGRAQPSRASQSDAGSIAARIARSLGRLRRWRQTSSIKKV